MINRRNFLLTALLLNRSANLETTFFNLAKVASGTTYVASDTLINGVISEKANVLSILANDNLLNSEFTVQLTSELDKTAPTFGYSAMPSCKT